MTPEVLALLKRIYLKFEIGGGNESKEEILTDVYNQIELEIGQEKLDKWIEIEYLEINLDTWQHQN